MLLAIGNMVVNRMKNGNVQTERLFVAGKVIAKQGDAREKIGYNMVCVNEAPENSKWLVVIQTRYGKIITVNEEKWHKQFNIGEFVGIDFRDVIGVGNILIGYQIDEIVKLKEEHSDGRSNITRLY